jgi:transglutaminase-like putative cysteine protease
MPPETPTARRGASEGWITFILLLPSVMVTNWVVGRTHWAPTGGLYPLAFGGALAGFLLAKVRFRGPVLIVTGLLVGLCLSLYYLSGLGGGATGLARYADVTVRLFTGDRVSAGGSVSFDQLLVGFLFVFAPWLTAFICSWSFFRKHNIWGAVLPSGVIVVVTVAIVPFLAQKFLLYLYLVIVCLLIASLFVLEREHDWNQRNVRRRHLDSVLLPKALGFSLAIVIIASLLPTPSAKIDPTVALWDRVIASARTIGGWSGGVDPQGPAQYPVSSHRFEDTDPFKGGVTLGDEPVLLVTAPFPVYLRARSYDVYRHEGWETSDTHTMPIESSAELGTEPGPEKSQQVEVSVQVLFLVAGGAPIYLAGYPIDMSIDYRLEALRPVRYEISFSESGAELASEEGRLPLDLQETVSRLLEIRNGSDDRLTEEDIRSALPEDVHVVSLWLGMEGFEKVTVERDVPIPPDTVCVHIFGPISPESSYQSTVGVSAADRDDLLAAGTKYPGWVMDRYLQLPGDMPSRVMDLAQKLSGDAATPYEKAVTICDYLRKLRYAVDIEAPPEGTDGVDYFLFETKEGYCQYFASAMTVLLRASGVPARMAVGYGPGEPVEEDTGDKAGNPKDASQDSEPTFAVRDSHAWCEVFFPGYGWINFEPTPAYPRLDHTGISLPPPGPGAGGNETSPIVEPETPIVEPETPAVEPGGTHPGTPCNVGLLGILLGLGLFCAVMWLGWRRMLGRVSEPRVAYARIGYLASLSGLGPRENLTPHEYGRKLAAAVPRMEAPLNQIVRTYVRASYSSHGLSSEERFSIARAWPQVRNHLLRHALRGALSLKFRRTGQDLDHPVA